MACSNDPITYNSHWNVGITSILEILLGKYNACQINNVALRNMHFDVEIHEYLLTLKFQVYR